MSAPPRQLRITYGTTAASGTLSGATLTLHDVHSISKTADEFSVSYSVLVSGTTEALFSAGVASFEEAMNTRRQDLKVETLTAAGAVDQTLLSLSHTGNSGLNITAEISKAGGPADTITSRLYEVTISGGLPTKAALSGLRSFEYDVTFSPSRRATLSVRGTYTAVSSTQAKAQYLASIAARVSSITTALTGTWELVDETYTPDDTDQVVSFSRTYKELIFAESESSLNVAAIVDQVLSIKSDRLGSEGLRDERKLSTITATYSAGINKDETTDLESLWSSTIRPWVVKCISDVAGDRFAIVSQSVDYDRADNRISATISAQARNGGDVLSKTLSDSLEVDMGIIFARTWPTGSPGRDEPTDAYVYQGPKTIRRTLTANTTILGAASPTQIKTQRKSGSASGGGLVAGRGGGEGLGLFALGASSPGESILDFSAGNASRKGGGSSLSTGGRGGGGSAQGGVLVKRTDTVENRSLGLPGEQIDVHDRATVEVYEFVNPISSGGSAGARAGTRAR